MTRTTDIDGNGTVDMQTVDARVLGGDGSVTRTVSDYAGNGTTLTGRTAREESADRRVVTVTTDANGDGATDRVVGSVEAADGSTTVTDTSYYANGTVAAKTTTVTSANGLVSTTTLDTNGDLLDETVVASFTVLNANGSQVQTVDTDNGDGSNRTLSVTTTSDDGLVVTVQSDLDGDNLFDRVNSSTTVLHANGSVTDTDQLRAQNTALLSQVQTTVSDDGLITVTRSDADGDGDFDLTTTQTTTLLNDGGTSVIVEVRDLVNVLRSRTTTATSDDGRSVSVSEDVNGDGQVDRQTTRVVANDGTITQTTSEFAETGALLSRERTVISDDGLSETREWDRDGDGQYERRTEAVRVHNADGSVTQTTTGRGSNSDAYVASIVTVSDDGLTTTRADDLDGDGTADLTTVSTTSLAANGIKTETVEHRSEDNSLLDRTVVVTSADQRTITESVDADGNGVNDRVSEIDAGRIGMVVVYKIDRLTRSLVDFGRLVERLDARGCSFVSVRPVFAVLKAVAVVQEIVGSGGYLGLGGRRVSTVDIFDVYFLVNRLRAIVRHLVRGREGYPRGARPRLTGGVTIM